MKQSIDKRIKDLYGKYDNDTVLYMSSIHIMLKKKFGYIDNCWLPQLQILARNYEIYKACSDTIREEGLLVDNRFGVTDKHPLMKTMLDMQIQIMKMVNEFGLSPKSISKIKEVDDETDSDFLEKLIS